jgi:glycosyltransferase involved in cell wall biosynthesis
MELGARDDVAVTLIGHPHAAIGMGEQLRSHVRALSAVQAAPGVLDIFRHARREDPWHAALIDKLERRDVPGGIRVFHINGDEIERVLAAFEALGGRLEDGLNVIVPAWELPRYPKVWADQLARFDEVWAISRFVQNSLAAAGVASHVVGQSVEPVGGFPFLPRRWFGIRESALVLLHLLDLSSYAARKNPDAALALLDRLVAARPQADIQLVLKVKNAAQPAAEWATSVRGHANTLVLSEPMDTQGVRSLIRACDCFVSLHRSEGFGRGLGEAMAEGRLALGTGWSGNVDFMTEANSLMVGHKLVRVRKDAYPHAAGQSWAEPDVGHAAELLLPVMDDPARGWARAEIGRRDVLRSHGDRAVGLRVLDRLEALAADLPVQAAVVKRPRRVAAAR